MALRLVSLAEIVAALDGVEQVQIKGVIYVDVDDVDAALNPVLSAFGPPPAAAPSPLEDTATDAPHEPPAAMPTDAGLEAERARLAALPPGPCVGCGAVHPEGPTERCDDYVDKTVRDPVQARIDRGIVNPNPEPIAPLYEPEATLDYGRRPAHNAHRPPVG